MSNDSLNMTFPDDLTTDQAYDAACEQDSQIADCAVAAAQAMEEGNWKNADHHLSSVLDLNEAMREAAEIGGLDDWIEYADALEERVCEIRQDIEDGKEWDAFEKTVEIPEMPRWFL